MAEPWWYSRRPRRTLIIGLAVVLLCLLRLAGDGLSIVALLLGGLGVCQIVSGVLSVRRAATADMEQRSG